LSCGNTVGVASGGGSGNEGSDHGDDADAHDEDDGGDGRDDKDDGGVDADGNAGSVQFVCIAHSTCHRWLNELLAGWFFAGC